MEQEIVGKIVAKLAKEKGFDEWCNNYYQCVKQDIYDDTYRTILKYSKDYYEKVTGSHKNSISIKYSVNNGEYWEDYSAPTQSFLSDWLRIKFNLDIYVVINSLTCYFPMIQLIDIDGTKGKGPVYKNYGSYEKAFEAGLYEALLLVKYIE